MIEAKNILKGTENTIPTDHEEMKRVIRDVYREVMANRPSIEELDNEELNNVIGYATLLPEEAGSVMMVTITCDWQMRCAILHTRSWKKFCTKNSLYVKGITKGATMKANPWDPILAKYGIKMADNQYIFES